MTTIKDVAKNAGVSVATVSRVIRGVGYVSEGTRKRVQDAIHSLGYRPNALARSMVERRTYAMALVISDIANPFFTSVVRGVEDAAHQQGYTVLLGNSDEDPEREREYLSAFMQRQVDGFIVVSTASNADHLAKIVASGVPVVLLDRNLNVPGADAVLVDNEAAAYRAVRYLLELGHRRIGIIVGPPHIPTSSARLAGYRRALQEFGIENDRDLVRFGDFKEKGGADGVKALLALDRPPTAIFTANNLTSMGALIALRDAGVRVPEQLSVVGFDDLPWSRVVDPPLTVIEQPSYVLGMTAAQLLLSRLSGRETPAQGRTVTLTASLIVRASCAPPQDLRGKAVTDAASSATRDAASNATRDATSLCGGGHAARG